MNASDLIQSYFDPDAVARLAQAAGLEPQVAGQVLEAGLPLQLQALAASAGTPEGEAMIAEASGSLPAFGSVAAALDEAGGASNLQQAGDLLGPALLGDAAQHLAAQVAQQTAVDSAHVQTLLQMALPLLLSRLGQAGLGSGNVLPVLANLQLDGLNLDGAAQPEEAAVPPQEAEAAVEGRKPPAEEIVAEPLPEHVVPDAPVALDSLPEPPLSGPDMPAQPVPVPLSEPSAGLPESLVVAPALADSGKAVPTVEGTDLAPADSSADAEADPLVAAQTSGVPEATDSSEPPAADPNTPEGLLAYLQARFSGSVGHQIGAVAGFGGGARRQAAAAALPVVLSALVGQAQAGGGAIEVGKLRSMARPFDGLTDADGRILPNLLDSPVEVARIEGQGRGLLGSLFGDLNGVTGRLGSALGGSGDSSRRLLALMTPLVLSALTRTHPEGSSALGGLLGQLGGFLPALLPAGVSSLGVVVRNLANGTPLPGAVSARPAVPVVKASPRPPAPSPLKPARPVTANTPPPAPPTPPPARRTPLWWWLIPLLALLLGGWWLLQNRPAAPTSAVPETSVAETTGPAPTESAAASAPAITEPQDGAQVAATGFTLRGTGPAGELLTLLQDGRELGPVAVGDDGTWSQEVGSQEVAGDTAASGQQTYSLNDAAGAEVARVQVQVGAADDAAEPPAPASDDAASSAPGADGAAEAAASAGLTVGRPDTGAEVSAAGFELSGTGTPGDTFEVLEDGVSIGSFTVDTDGRWTRQVPGPSLGAKTYVIRDAAGQEVTSLPLTVVAAAVSAQGAACTQALSVSLNDGDTVTAPYRFGGVGDARAYTVTVKRGERVIGSKTVQVGPGCTWNFTSNPGGAAQTSQITYEVRAAEQTATDAPAAQLTLNVR